MAANMAELVDLMHYWLQNEYAKWIYDPDDPANKKQRKVKPPPIPLIPPVAHRPLSVAEQYQSQFEELTAQFGTETAETVGPSEKRFVSPAEFDAVLDLL